MKMVSSSARTMVERTEIQAAVQAIEEAQRAGKMNHAEATRRITDCRRTVTPRDLWKASGGRAGSRRRSDWFDIRRLVFGLAALLALIALGIWMVTWIVSQSPQ